MLKRMFLSLIILSLGQFVLAKEIEVNIYTPTKITTSNIDLKEGDSLNFIISKDIYLNSKLFIKSGETVTGVITSMQNNGFVCEPATIFVENFRTKNADGKTIKLVGNIYKKGRTHWMFTQFLPVLPELIRGGEVQIKKNDSFIIYLDEKL